jgi:uncharacterized damage-inducible protein DinB
MTGAAIGRHQHATAIRRPSSRQTALRDAFTGGHVLRLVPAHIGRYRLEPEAFNVTLAEPLLPEFDQGTARTRTLLERVPAERLDFRPHPKSMTLGRLAGHVAELPDWLVVTMDTEVFEREGFESFKLSSKASLLEKFDSAVTAAHASLAGATDEALAVNWPLRWQGQTIVTMPRRDVVRSMVLNHLVHHRTQLGVSLRLNDVAIPGTYGPSADDRPPG